MDDQIVTVKGVQFRIATAHAASSYGQSVVVCPDGEALGAADLYETPEGLVTGAEIMAAARAATTQSEEQANEQT